MRAFRRLIDAIDTEGSAALVTLTCVEGSNPREAGGAALIRPGDRWRSLRFTEFELCQIATYQASLARSSQPRVSCKPAP